jgi:hypothetical protein
MPTESNSPVTTVAPTAANAAPAKTAARWLLLLLLLLPYPPGFSR